MNKYMLLVLNFLCVVVATQAQQHQYSWKIGVHGGFSTYYGDLSHQFFDVHHKMTSPFQNLDFWAYGLSVEHHVNRFFGLKLMGFKSQILANDRTYTNSANYDRGLNFQTDIVDVSLLGTFYLDNGTVFGHKAVVSPYFLFGVGFTYFDTKADLFGNNGGRYYYWSDNTIRTLGEADPNANSAQVIIQDQKYETAVKNLKTEGDNYQPFTWNVSAGLGFKFRLSKRFHLHLEAMLKYTGTDYLDDVSGKYLPYYVDNFQGYAANPTNSSNVYRGTSPNMNDWYTFLALSLHYSFGQKTYDIRPSILYTPLLVVTDTIKKEFVIVKETQDSLMSNNTNGQIVKTVITTITTTNNANNVPQNIEIDSVIIEKEEANVLENYSKDSVVLVEKVIVSNGKKIT